MPLPWPNRPPTLTDGVAALRPWRGTDADAVFAACQDADIQRRMLVPAPFLREHAVEVVGDVPHRLWENQHGAPFAVVDVRGEALLGSCGLVDVDAHELVGEVAYWVAPWARGRGVAQRALTLLCRWALTEGGLARLELLVEPDNVPSCAVAERVGFEREGVLRSKTLLRGTRRDLAMYALLPEWLGREDQP